MSVFFTADWHLGHKNILKYIPARELWFKDIATMDNALLYNCNLEVKEKDQLYILGDLALCPVDTLTTYLNNLKCKNLYLIEGNHDYRWLQCKELRRYFKFVEDLATLNISGLSLTLCHYAMRVWPKKHYGAVHLYGHSHGTLPAIEGDLSMDVGVDANNYKPVSLETIKQKFNA